MHVAYTIIVIKEGGDYMKIVLVSDNHFQTSVLNDILNKHQDADFYLHCGDSQMTDTALMPFTSIKGNNDFFPFPKQKIIKLNDYFQLMMIHGDQLGYYIVPEKLAAIARRNDCNIICYGHTHIPFHEYIMGVYVLNPGSTSFPRSSMSKTYMIIEIHEDQIETTVLPVPKHS